MKYQTPLIKASLLAVVCVITGVFPAEAGKKKEGSLLSIYSEREPAGTGEEGVYGAIGRRGAPMPQASTGGSHRVSEGETLTSIARRHRVSTTELLTANRLKDPNSLMAGQTLRIPGKAAPPPTIQRGRESISRTREVEDRDRYSEDREDRGREPISRTPAPGRAPASAGYQVRNGDTLTSIARRNGVTLTELMRANRISNANSLQAGQVLSIPGKGAPPREREREFARNDRRNSDEYDREERPSDRKTERNRGAGSESYRIKGTETLYSLARQNGITVDEILAANPNVDPNRLRPGIKIMIPVTGSVARRSQQFEIPQPVGKLEPISDRNLAVASDSKPNANASANSNSSPTPKAKPKQSNRNEDHLSPSPVVNGMDLYLEYEVQPGDTWEKLAHDFHITKSKLREINGSGSFDEVRAGERIQVPRTRFGKRVDDVVY